MTIRSVFQNPVTYYYYAYVCVAHTDYSDQSRYIRIPSGVTSFSFRILIYDDDIIEGYETFDLQIYPSSLSDNIYIGSQSRATVTIVDDDCEYFKAIIAAYYMELVKFLQPSYIAVYNYNILESRPSLYAVSVEPHHCFVVHVFEWLTSLVYTFLCRLAFYVTIWYMLL